MLQKTMLSLNQHFSSFFIEVFLSTAAIVPYIAEYNSNVTIFYAIKVLTIRAVHDVYVMVWQKICKSVLYV